MSKDSLKIQRRKKIRQLIVGTVTAVLAISFVLYVGGTFLLVFLGLHQNISNVGKGVCVVDASTDMPETSSKTNELVMKGNHDMDAAYNNDEKLTLSEYQANCMKTAMWPNVGGNLVYTSLGLSSEVGEVCSHIKKAIRDDDSILTEERREKLRDEIGDVLYYVAALSHECGFDLDDIAKRNTEKLFDRLERGVIKGDGDKR